MNAPCEVGRRVAFPVAEDPGPSLQVRPTLDGLIGIAARRHRDDADRFRMAVDQGFGAVGDEPMLASTVPVGEPVELRFDEQVWAWAETALTPFDDRILHGRIFIGGDRMTLDALGRQLGVTRERVRQIEKSARAAIASAWRLDGVDVHLEALAAVVVGRTGRLTTADLLRDAIEAAVRQTSAVSAEDRLGLRRRILGATVGEWHSANGRLHHPTLERALEGRRAALSTVGPGRPLDEDVVASVCSEFELDCVDAGHVAAVLGVKQVAGRWLRWTGSLGDKAVGVLKAAGRPMTGDDLQAILGFRTNPRSLRNAMAGDARLLRRGKDSWGLREWGGEEYEGIVAELEQALARAGGPIVLEDLVTTFVDRFGVSAHSVRAYANSWRFVVENGRIRLPGAADGDRAVRQLAPRLVRGLLLLDGVWHVRLPADADGFRGSGRPLRNSAALLAGLEPDLIFRVDYGAAEVTLSWRGNQPAIGSVKPLLEALGAVEGDRLLLPLEGPEPRRPRLVRLLEMQGLCGAARLRIESGLAADASDQELLAVYDLPAGAYLADLADLLRDREETELLQLLPESLR